MMLWLAGDLGSRIVLPGQGQSQKAVRSLTTSKFNGEYSLDAAQFGLRQTR